MPHKLARSPWVIAVGMQLYLKVLHCKAKKMLLRGGSGAAWRGVAGCHGREENHKVVLFIRDQWRLVQRPIRALFCLTHPPTPETHG